MIRNYLCLQIHSLLLLSLQYTSCHSHLHQTVSQITSCFQTTQTDDGSIIWMARALPSLEKVLNSEIHGCVLYPRDFIRGCLKTNPRPEAVVHHYFCQSTRVNWTPNNKCNFSSIFRAKRESWYRTFQTASLERERLY